MHFENNYINSRFTQTEYVCKFNKRLDTHFYDELSGQVVTKYRVAFLPEFWLVLIIAVHFS